MCRLVRIAIGLALVSYSISSGNNWFLIGIIPLVSGLANFCILEKIVGKCTAKGCNTSETKDENSSCCSSDEKEESSCCATPEEQVSKFSESKPKEKTSCCATPDEQVAKFTEEEKDNKTSCCSTPDEQVKQFTASKPENKTSCCSEDKNKMTIKILGTGCQNCTILKQTVDTVVSSRSEDIEVLKVEDIKEIMSYNLVSTPGLVINEEVKSTGKVLNEVEVNTLIDECIKK